MIEKPNWLQMVWLLLVHTTLTFTANLLWFSLSFMTLNSTTNSIMLVCSWQSLFGWWLIKLRFETRSCNWKVETHRSRYLSLTKTPKVSLCKLIQICPCHRLKPAKANYFFDGSVFHLQPEECWDTTTDTQDRQNKLSECDRTRAAHMHAGMFTLYCIFKSRLALYHMLCLCLTSDLWPPSTGVLSEHLTSAGSVQQQHFLTVLWFQGCLCLEVFVSLVSCLLLVTKIWIQTLL